VFGRGSENVVSALTTVRPTAIASGIQSSAEVRSIDLGSPTFVVCVKLGKNVLDVTLDRLLTD
jgi:hypothetical protein